jgi:Na+:H+ antiporter, NhaA family
VTSGPSRLPSLFGAVVRPLQVFFQLEAASGVLLLAAALAALAWANSDAVETYRSTLAYPFVLGAGGVAARFTLHELVNDGLMTLFFFVVGMEIKRELVGGELRTPARAMLPAIAALGGMIVPAAIFLAFNPSSAGRVGWAIPMATDIAFSIGCLTLLKSRVPYGLIVFLTALAIFDDIGGILVIAAFYGHGLNGSGLVAAGVATAVVVVMGRAHVRYGLAYTAVGAALWYALHHAGIHATLAGVVLGLAIPAAARRSAGEVLRELADHLSSLRRRNEHRDHTIEAAELLRIEERIEDVQSPLDRYVHLLHPYVAFGVMPLFALANAGVSLEGAGRAELLGRVALGAGAGLFFGKMIGVFSFTWLVVKLGWAPMPAGASAAKLLGVSIVAGIGFTVALFIAALAYAERPELLAQAKVGILAGSLLAGIVGTGLLRLTPPVRVDETEA